MIKELDENLYAFPHKFISAPNETTVCFGMTLRDYFAAKALDVSMNQVRNYYGIKHEEVAIWCYQMADAMLKVREQ